jgi:hypothetical protein
MSDKNIKKKLVKCFTNEEKEKKFVNLNENMLRIQDA